MIPVPSISQSDAARRAELIYAEARSQIDVRLWRAALGNGGASSRVEASTSSNHFASSSMLSTATIAGLGTAMVAPRTEHRNALAGPVNTDTAASAKPAALARQWPAAVATVTGLGANSSYSSTIAAAARRTGIPEAALATIIDAESAKNKAGVWQPNSRNARSSATGLGQFLSGTWKSEAQRPGTWLNNVARRNGWLGTGGTVLPEMEASLLALRNDASASINATADYARRSLDKLAAAGATIGTSVNDVARAAYLGHNLGLGDAVRFLKGELSETRARTLLDAQVGKVAAMHRTAESGGAAAAHRGWLLGFMARHINVSRFLG